MDEPDPPSTTGPRTLLGVAVAFLTPTTVLSLTITEDATSNTLQLGPSGLLVGWVWGSILGSPFTLLALAAWASLHHAGLATWPRACLIGSATGFVFAILGGRAMDLIHHPGPTLTLALLVVLGALTGLSVWTAAYARIPKPTARKASSRNPRRGPDAGWTRTV